MNHLVLFGLFLHLVLHCNFVWGNGNRLQLKIIRHQPCSKDSSNVKLLFPNSDEAPLQQDLDRGDGCYSIKGTVRVLQPIRGTIQLYVDTKFGTKAPSEPCQGADENNCGGAGSCICCDPCQGIKDLGRSDVQLAIGNRQLDCKNGLEAKNYTDTGISFCMLPKDEFLKRQHVDEEFWRRYGSSGQTIFLTIYIVNKQINTLSHEEVLDICTPDNEDVIGCHKLVGSIYEPSSS